MAGGLMSGHNTNRLKVNTNKFTDVLEYDIQSRRICISNSLLNKTIHIEKLVTFIKHNIYVASTDNIV
jgi:hypothetical protein